eukprot:Rhum_TRINITY_DN16536_c0_g1::Rhum_TRINITY_DN16536_c0_g1_i1::g.163582::m.163582
MVSFGSGGPLLVLLVLRDEGTVLVDLGEVEKHSHCHNLVLELRQRSVSQREQTSDRGRVGGQRNELVVCLDASSNNNVVDRERKQDGGKHGPLNAVVDAGTQEKHRRRHLDHKRVQHLLAHSRDHLADAGQLTKEVDANAERRQRQRERRRHRVTRHAELLSLREQHDGPGGRVEGVHQRHGPERDHAFVSGEEVAAQRAFARDQVEEVHERRRESKDQHRVVALRDICKAEHAPGRQKRRVAVTAVVQVLADGGRLLRRTRVLPVEVVQAHVREVQEGNQEALRLRQRHVVVKALQQNARRSGRHRNARHRHLVGRPPRRHKRRQPVVRRAQHIAEQDGACSGLVGISLLARHLYFLSELSMKYRYCSF